MKFILKILKWIAKFLAGFLFLLILLGVFFRLISSIPEPPGELIEVDGTQIHIRVDGKKNDLPTLILEAGGNSDTDIFHWVSKGLNKSVRIIRYDREGKWFSEASQDSITSEYYAHQLHELLEISGEKPPYILVGHSMGGPYNRIFRDLYPDEVIGMVFIDSSHPEQKKRLMQTDLSKIESLHKRLSILADMGIIGLVDKVFGPLFNNNSELPEACQKRYRKLFVNSGKVLRRSIKENRFSDKMLLRAGQARDLDSLPVLVFTAAEEYNEFRKKNYLNRGVDPNKELQLWFEMQSELKELSTKGRQFYIDANHGSIITKKQNAEIINKEIRSMIDATESNL